MCISLFLYFNAREMKKMKEKEEAARIVIIIVIRNKWKYVYQLQSEQKIITKSVYLRVVAAYFFPLVSF